jgi:protein arginine N-methyltransferase 1
MVADRRSDLYADALRRTVRPGQMVVDVGTGTGLWALFACALGARRVVAIEPDSVIAFAMELARVNGFADRITFVSSDVRDAVLDEPADVVVADLRDVLPFAPESVTGMMHARRWLKPGGLLIPQRDRLWLAAVEAPEAHRARAEPWETARFDGLDLSPLRRAALSLPRKERFEPRQVITTTASWAEIDYRTVLEPNVSGVASLVAERSGVAHGLAVWFDAELTDDVTLVNQPEAPPLLYGQAFLPWPNAVHVEAGDRMDVSIRAIHDGRNYTLTWKSVVTAVASGDVRAAFEQSTFDAVPLVARAIDLVSKPARGGPERS